MKKMITMLVIIFMLIHIEIMAHGRPAPETVIVGVTKLDGITPETNASCKADIITPESTVEDKQLTKIESIFEYVDLNSFDPNKDKGFYELDTGLKDYKGEFEIKIVCINPNYSGVSYTIINNTNMLCELVELKKTNNANHMPGKKSGMIC